MRFNPLTKSLFTDDGQLLKRLSCPYKVGWNRLARTDDPGNRICDICAHPIIDTASMAEDHLQTLMEQQPETCLKVSLDQDNITITYQS